MRLSFPPVTTMFSCIFREVPATAGLSASNPQSGIFCLLNVVSQAALTGAGNSAMIRIAPVMWCWTLTRCAKNHIPESECKAQNIGMRR